MRLRFLLLLAAFSATQAVMFAQEAPAPDTGLAATAAASVYQMFEPGDNLLSLSAGASFGLGFYNPLGSKVEPAHLKPGILIGLSYLYFIDNLWALFYYSYPVFGRCSNSPERNQSH